jgi:hypothetical protein
MIFSSSFFIVKSVKRRLLRHHGVRVVVVIEQLRGFCGKNSLSFASTAYIRSAAGELEQLWHTKGAHKHAVDDIFRFPIFSPLPSTS